MKKGGFTTPVRPDILRRITSIKKEWNSGNSLPRKLIIQSIGKKIHYEPYWIMEFLYQDRNRRFFKIKDQLKNSSIETLKFLQKKLDLND